jgi:hypothetical protein
MGGRDLSSSLLPLSLGSSRRRMGEDRNMKQYVLGRLARILAVVTLGASIVVVPLGTRAAQAAPETVVSLTFTTASQASTATPGRCSTPAG